MLANGAIKVLVRSYSHPTNGVSIFAPNNSKSILSPSNTPTENVTTSISLANSFISILYTIFIVNNKPANQKHYSPTNLVLFGITGDLAAKKIIPALYHLHEKRLLPEMLKIIGFSRRDLSDDSLRELVVEIMAKHKDSDPLKDQLESFLRLFMYHQGNFQNLDDYKKLGERLGRSDDEWKVCSNKLFYLSVPPNYYGDMFKNLSESGLTEPCSDEEGWTRVIVEKPFGEDLKTAQELDKTLAKLFKEEQIYRIDHYLGKEMLQNVLMFRFANNLLESSWSNKVIEKIEITIPESFGVENRGNFYDGVGALRDVGQNHLLQMLAITTMEDPGDFTDISIRKKRAELLSGLKVLTADEIKKSTKRAQYKDYKNTEGVDKDSKTETYFRVEAHLDNLRWEDVPIILEHGKKQKDDDKKITVYFKGHGKHKNVVTFDLEGDDAGIYIDFWAKKPGLDVKMEKRTLSFSLCDDIEACNIAEEYEKLLIDCIVGNQTLFVSTQEINAMWKFIDPIIRAWEQDIVPLEYY